MKQIFRENFILGEKLGKMSPFNLEYVISA
jgi:hypothetical protein